MVIKHTVEGYEEYLKITKELESKKVVFYVLFTGSLNETGESWCKDCVKAEPLIEEVVKKLPDTVHFVKVHVGNREYWKDQNCPFRKDKKAHVTTIPTIIRWDGPQRLEDADFNNIEVISMAFEDDWKDTNCPFRTDRKARVATLPTIIRWDGPQRLQGTDFNNKDVISLAFEDEF